MVEYIEHCGKKIDLRLFRFVNDDAILGTGIDETDFWSGFSKIIDDLAPINHKLLQRREELQNLLDDWHIANRRDGFDLTAYKAFLTHIGYLVEEGGDFQIETDNVDPEINTIAGPQLVVPITNARFALNAANARWGSLYDALYGSDAIGDGKQIIKEQVYNSDHGEKVIQWSRNFLDKSAPLADGKYADATLFQIIDGQLIIELGASKTTLASPEQFAGYLGDPASPDAVVLKTNELHLEIKFDPNHLIGKNDRAGISNILLESAISTIMDCEDSVATVDGEDKVLAYQNWLGLMRGDLAENFKKDDKIISRKLAKDKILNASDGSTLCLPARSLMLIRNVGHLMNNRAILDNLGNEVPEGIMDCVISSLISLHDIGKEGKRKNSPAGSMYIVKPKMHGPEEVAFSDELFSRTEQLLGLDQYTLKMGIMDEERRTSVNLKECIRAAKKRVVFINTGFLDRTGDEIHTSIEAGPMIKRSDMKQSLWINAYEDWNVDIGLRCGLKGKAQIGKGMWAMPDLMADMLEQKINHPEAGASTAWVPSPTAATLHATHYHQINVGQVQQKIARRQMANLDDILAIPVAQKPNWPDSDIQFEIDNCAQSILGYVVRWIDQGIGCSKVPDIHGVGLMEDRQPCAFLLNFWQIGYIMAYVHENRC